MLGCGARPLSCCTVRYGTVRYCNVQYWSNSNTRTVRYVPWFTAPTNWTNEYIDLNDNDRPRSLFCCVIIMNTLNETPVESCAHVFVRPESPGSISASLGQLRSHKTSRKRKQDDGSTYSSTTADFPASTRTTAKALLGGKCFHCGMESGLYSPLDVCHVIIKKSAHVITLVSYLSSIREC